ncbi:hypothetical protein ASPWEDRAFT_109394 [Aspergillus wentii DTO 134E9]|uniref:Actin-like ATPase domain-containing protein n=1 Tax=Aspergillus wentii DTO 134E9 TaxID=1073089 RepID=A0A1L9RNN0_ASPWE|nr:uncharacterized protein ASPWEDRAFT_109394 [Aspergillus wentii DTO 134E9]OJJ36559.1 hypothetical protein ASPWEDRAFT_109394 [Aspergillus wentii DTO 134E9]
MASSSTAGSGESKRPFSSSSNIPSNLRHSQSARPSSPHTPSHQLRSNNSSFASTSSASSSFRGEGDAIIFEFGSRWLRAGFEGDSTPMCVVGFGPEESRRAGDYRGWLKGSSSDAAQSQPLKADEWTSPYELWRMNLRDVDLGLVEDKIERVFRETYNKHLLTDAGTSRLVLVLPSVMPHPLLSSVLSTLFSRWRFPSITLVPDAAMSVTAAGVRSALVVDLGWEETTVTGVYEYREIASKRSTRAMKSLLQQTGKSLTKLASNGSRGSISEDEISVKFEYCEEIVSRFAWCKPSNEAPDSYQHNMISIPCPSNPSSAYIDVPFSTFADPVEKVLFAEDIAECDMDDEEKPIHLLAYNTLLALPPDVRGTCMSRIVFVGGGSNIPGVRQRILKEVGLLVKKHGWSQVRGKVIERQRQRMQNLSLVPQSTPAKEEARMESPVSPTAKKHHEGEEQQEEIDFVEQKLRRNNKDKDIKPHVHGILREVESLGPWAGASLITSLKIRGLVEIEREKYLQHGIAGASRDFECHGHVPDRRSGLRSGGDRSSWTLAGWG